MGAQTFCYLSEVQKAHTSCIFYFLNYIYIFQQYFSTYGLQPGAGEGRNGGLPGGPEALSLTQRYLVFPHKVHQVQRSSLRGAEKCPMPDSVRKQIQEDLGFFYLVWNLKKSRERASITSFSGS